MFENTHTEVISIAAHILDIIFRYKSPLPRDLTDRSDEGVLKFMNTIYYAVKSRRAVGMVLPAFPFKSPNSKDKVLGVLPDKAEEMALAHLNGMCAAIREIYAPGATLTIVSDGLVYNDLLGVPDHIVWNYGQKLRAITIARGYNDIQFAQLKDLLAPESAEDMLDDMSYAAAASILRLSLMNTYGEFEWSKGTVDTFPKVDDNKRTTYCGYLKFLELDLATIYPVGEDRTRSRFKKGIEKIAKVMLKRGDAFAKAVRAKFPNHVRLSIHPSTGEDKISIDILPTQNTITPWHCSVAFKIDGTLIAGHRQTFESSNTMELVYDGDKPSYFREKSDMYDWGSVPVAFDPMYPSGIMIRPKNGQCSVSIEDIHPLKSRELAERNSPVLLRGFSGTTDRENFVAKSHELGEPTPWKFGLVLEVKDQGTEGQGLNNVLSSEPMPFHFDGMFKTEKIQRDDGGYDLVPRPPRFQFFTAVTPSPKDTGFTLFSSSRLVFQHLPKSYVLEKLRSLTWSVSTPSFDESTISGLPLIEAHPSTGEPCLRYHERWPQSKTRFDPTDVKIENGDERVAEVLESLLHDRRVCLWLSWEQGDLLISDNFGTLHTRSSFTAQADRELWRIHFD